MAGVGPGVEGSGVGVLGGCMVVVQRGLSLLLVPVRILFCAEELVNHVYS